MVKPVLVLGTFDTKEKEIFYLRKRIEADLALINSLKQHLDLSKVLLQEVDLHINDPQFAEIAVDLLGSLMQQGGKGKK
jgi:uncharacterized protein (UPF0261 family)